MGTFQQLLLGFRYDIQRHLHQNAKENIIHVHLHKINLKCSLPQVQLFPFLQESPASILYPFQVSIAAFPLAKMQK